MKTPEISQGTQSGSGQRYQSVFVALGVTNMNSHIISIYITDSQVDAFAEAQTHAINGKKKNFIAQFARYGKKLVELLNV